MNKQRARGIGWCDYTWSPVTGCSPISEGCENCYAKRMAEGRLRGRYGYPAENPFSPIMHWDRAGNARKLPMKKKIFVGSMGDVFHENHSFKDLEALFAILDVWGDISEDTVLMFLTKRPQRMKEFFGYYANRVADYSVGLEWRFPKNWWLGISAENQPRLDERLHHLLQIPAAVKFVSIEPYLSSINLTSWLNSDTMVRKGGDSCHEGKRERVFGSSSNGLVYGGHQKRGNMEECTIHRRQQNGCRSLHENDISPESGEVGISRIPESDVCRGIEETDASICAPDNMDDSQPQGYSGELGNQPQRREQKKQSSIKPGSGDQKREHNPCGKGAGCPWEKGTKRREEHFKQINCRAGNDNQRPLLVQNHDSKSNSGNVRNRSTDSIKHPYTENLEVSALNWVIVGAETGPGARPYKREWVESIINQCRSAGVPLFLKDNLKWPEEIKEFPEEVGG